METNTPIHYKQLFYTITSDYQIILFPNKPIILSEIEGRLGDNLLLVIEEFFEKEKLEITFDELLPI